MSPEHIFFLFVFFVLMAFLVLYFPISGIKAMRQLKDIVTRGESGEKSRAYLRTMMGSWMPLILVFLLIPLSGISLSDIGIKGIDLKAASLSNWMVYAVLGVYALYILYNMILIISLKNSAKARAKAAKSIPGNLGWFMPVTREEKKYWTYLSISAGVTEEIIFRGYLFFALAVIFSGLTLLQILILSTLIFGVGHLYLGKEAIKSTLLGLLYGVFYIVFDSVIPVMIAHALQDLVMRYVIEEPAEGSKDSLENNSSDDDDLTY